MTQRIAENTLYIIDGSSFLYRAYYGLRPINTSKGVPVQAVYNFCRMVKKLIQQEHPSHMAIAWDSPGKTERHGLYTDYKAGRQAAPSDLGDQKTYIQQFADYVGIKQIAQQGVEADDLMYSLTKEARAASMNVVIVTSDKDLGQLVASNVLLLDPFKEITYTKEKLSEKYGFPIEKLPFYFALIGDSSDNIPGVRGIGPKTALELVRHFENLDDLYARIDEITKPRTKELLLASQQNAFLSLELFVLRYHPVSFSKDDYCFHEHHWQHARPLFEELEFASLLKELPPHESPETKNEAPRYDYVTVTTQEQLIDLCNEIRTIGSVALDTETDSVNSLNCTLVGISLCTRFGRAYYIPLKHRDEQQLPYAAIEKHLVPLLEDAHIKKYLHHAKFDAHVLYTQGIMLKGVTFDTFIAAGLVIGDDQRRGLKELSATILGESMISFKDIAKQGYRTFDQVPLELATTYAAADAHQTWQLVAPLQEKLHDERQESVFSTIEMPLLPILIQMEQTGIYLDTAQLANVDTRITGELAQLYETIVAMAGEPYQTINLNAPRQLEALLFQHLKLPAIKKTAQKTGYSTDQEVLEELATAHPIIPMIMRYRELNKLKSTYTQGLPSYIHPRTGRIHTSFSQTKTATGRLASTDPNLQNIPTTTSSDYSIRAAFKAKEDSLFLSADYSQIELRVLAHVSHDEALGEAFARGEDIHARTAAGLFESPLSAITHEQRQLAKRINFSILYGLTPYGLSKDLKITFAQAKHFIERYFAQYPGVVGWMEQTTAFAQEHGYVETAGGRRRYVPGIREKNKTLFDAARRIAINTVAQGTAAEIMKGGMINLTKELTLQNLNAQMLLQIHDELLIEVPHDEIEKTEIVVKSVLENVVQWSIPLVVTTRTGSTWHDVSK